VDGATSDAVGGASGEVLGIGTADSIEACLVVWALDGDAIKATSKGNARAVPPIRR
jgi:hypothetical protein